MRRQRHLSLGFAGAAAVAAAALAAAGCSSSSSSTMPGTTPASVSTGAGTGGPGTQTVTSYLAYTDGKAGPANKSLPPVYIGFVNQQGGPQVIGPLATTGAQMAVNYANAELGGIDGHPIVLDTCFIASAEEEGTGCAQKFLADKKVSVIDLGAVAIGAQSFFSTLGGAKPVIDGTALTPVDGAQKNTVILYGDSNHLSPPTVTYVKDVLHAKTAAVVYPEVAGLAEGTAQMKADLQAAGLTVRAVSYPATQTDLTSVLTAAGVQTADVVIPITDSSGCVNLAKSLTTLGITDPKKIVSAPLCLNGQVAAGLGDFPHWTYADDSSLYGDPTDPGMTAYSAVAKKFSTPADAPDPWNITNFGQLLTTIRFLNEVGYANITPQAVLAKMKAFAGPQALGAPALDCGKYANDPGLCNDRVQFFTYVGNHHFVRAAGWLQPPS